MANFAFDESSRRQTGALVGGPLRDRWLEPITAAAPTIGWLGHIGWVCGGARTLYGIDPATIPAMSNITFRPDDDDVNDRLSALASANKRPIAVELRAAVNIYLALQDLVRLREETARGKLGVGDREDLERRIKDDIGRVFLGAISRETRSLFKDATGAEYPVSRIGHRPTHFEKLIDWVVSDANVPQAG